MRSKSLVSIGTEKRGGSHQPHTFRSAVIPAGGITRQQSSLGAVLVYCKTVAASSLLEGGLKREQSYREESNGDCRRIRSEFALPGSSFSLLEPLNGFP
jgi:hypothetical protein